MVKQNTNVSLENARRAVAALRSNAAIAGRAPLELDRAISLLRQAEACWSGEADGGRALHFSHLAIRQVAIAVAAAKLRRDAWLNVIQ